MATDRPKAEWPYFIETGAAVPAVSLSDMKTWLKISTGTQDAEITALINGAVQTAEHLTRRDLINKKYLTFRDGFSDLYNCVGNYSVLIPGYQDRYGYACNGIELRKSRLQSITSIEYSKGGVWTLVGASIYYFTLENAYSRILLVEDEEWPADLDNREQAVRIYFTAGYGAASANIPADIITAIKSHVANAFANRGDCATSSFLPTSARMTYMNNRIMEIGV